jgi:HrpA-like RNA helicase
MGLGNPRLFDYIEVKNIIKVNESWYATYTYTVLLAPSMDFINSSMDFLYKLGAIDSKERLLGLGSVLANLPVDATIGKMLVLGVVIY